MCYSMTMTRVALIAGLAVLWLALDGGAALAADPAGPPVSAAPPPPAPVAPYTPPRRGGPRPAESDAATYEHCLTLAKTDPGAARDLAERWQGKGGAHPADHCYAVSLVGLKQYKEGATRLETLAQAMLHAPNSLRAEVLDQASQAWLLAGDPARAYAADGAALNLLPGDADILVDRAEAAGSAGWYDKAVADLDRVLKTDPSRVDALIYRASANRELNQLDLAFADADHAVSLAPSSTEALLERGNILRLKGDLNGARKDWIRVSQLAPGSAADAAAKTNIERLEMKDDAAAPANAPAKAVAPAKADASK
jgi:tetratricopeptide (TPR) repeat protein